MKYRKTHVYKYKVEEREVFELPSCLNFPFSSKFLSIVDGKLIVSRDYRWDGPSGPAIDTKNFMRGSLAHDALYQLMRKGVIPRSLRKEADKLLRQHCKEDGMWWPRRQAVYLGVRIGGKSSTKKKEYPILQAP